MARGQQTATGLLYGPRSGLAGKRPSRPKQRPEAQPWSLLSDLEAEQCFQLLGPGRRPGDPQLPPGSKRHRLFWSSLRFRDRWDQEWQQCLSVGRAGKANQSSGSRKLDHPELAIFSWLVQVSEGKVVEVAQRCPHGPSLKEAITSIAGPLSSSRQPGAPALERSETAREAIAWQVAERLGLLPPRRCQPPAA